jgi:SAM-dependent methyltransferase
MTTATYDGVMRANIEMHTRLADSYRGAEPHYRPENVALVKRRLSDLVQRTGATRLLDLGCGAGFMIDIARDLVGEIHGVDITPAMMSRIDTSGPARIEIFEADSGAFTPHGLYEIVTAYSFLHHLYDVTATCRTAFKALTEGGCFYADLEPNFYFWNALAPLERGGSYDPIVTREIEMVTYKDEDFEKSFGMAREVFHAAEWGKSELGGFREEELRETLLRVGFRAVDVQYHWFLGQSSLLNDPRYVHLDRHEFAAQMDAVLQRTLPLCRSLYKYLRIIATK